MVSDAAHEGTELVSVSKCVGANRLEDFDQAGVQSVAAVGVLMAKVLDVLG